MNDLLALQPNQPPFLFLGPNINIVSTDSITCSHTYSSDEWFFKCHWPHFPTMPGSLQQEAMTQLAGILLFSSLESKPSHLLLRSINSSLFLKPIAPNTDVLITANLLSNSRNIYSFQASITCPKTLISFSKCRFKLVDPSAFDKT